MSIVRTPRGRWRVQVKSRGVVVADQTFDLKRDATAWESEQKRRLSVGTFVPPAAGKTTVSEVATVYLERRKQSVALRTWESDATELNAHILPALGARPVGSVTPNDLQGLLDRLATTHARGTVAKVRVTLRGLFAFAVVERRIQTSPGAALVLPRPDRVGASPASAVNPFTLDELVHVAETQRNRPRQHASTRRYADVTLVLGLTGLRFGELRGLRVGDLVELPYPALLVSRSLPESARNGAVIERVTTKSGRSRLVPLSHVVLPVVREWARDRDAAELLFPAPEGGYLRTSNWRRAVRWDETGKGRRPHDLRHTAATLWLTAGVDVKTVSAWLGHASTKLTLDTYGHWMGTDADRAAIARVNAVMGTGVGHATGTREGDEGASESFEQSDNWA